MTARPGLPVRSSSDVRYGADGSLPVIAVDAADGRVLMLGHADAEAVDATLSSGALHFHSRSRDRLWRKGESSGNVLRVRELVGDCDADAILAIVEPAGPTCHRGTRSCFDVDGVAVEPPEGFAWLEALWTTIASRAAARPVGSYTARLLDGGVDAVSRKVTEEATELLLAAKDHAAAADASAAAATRDALAGEAADLLYHLLVLLAERGVPPGAVIDVLRARTGGGPAVGR